MIPSGRSLIAGTEHSLRSGERILGAAEPDHPVTVTIYLRRAPGRPEGQAPSAEDLLSGRANSINRTAAENALRASPEDLASVESFLRREGLRVVEETPAARQIRAHGTAAQINSAFGVEMKNAAIGDNGPYLTYDGAITVPSALAGVVTAVLGLDNRPVATHH